MIVDPLRFVSPHRVKAPQARSHLSQLFLGIQRTLHIGEGVLPLPGRPQSHLA